jgi:hypothetical protein
VHGEKSCRNSVAMGQKPTSATPFAVSAKCQSQAPNRID